MVLDLKKLFIFFTFFNGGTRDWTQDLIRAKVVLYHWTIAIPDPDSWF